MKELKLLTCILLLTVSACNNSRSTSNPTLELKAKNPLQLTITNFHWSYSKPDKSVQGDFATLDQKVYELLKGKDGSCEVFIEDENGSSKLKSIGVISIQFVNNASSWQEWEAKRGIARMIKWKFTVQEQPIDSSRVDTRVYDPKESVEAIDSATQIPHTENDSVQR